MGVTTIDEITVNAVKNWRAAIDGERKASILWNSKWGWIVDEYRLVGDELIDLKKKRELAETKKKVDTRTVLPFPVTTAEEIGWLSGRPEFKLDRFGPYPYTRGWSLPVEPPESYFQINEQEEQEDTTSERGRRSYSS